MSKYFNGTGTIGFSCDNCGRELLGCTWVNGMKFCAKCYQEIFVNNVTFTNNTPSANEAFVDMLNKEMYELKIVELEAKLAEKEEYIEMLIEEKGGYIDLISVYADKCKKHNQDKITFAIEKLEKVKELLLEKCGETHSKSYCGIDEDIEEVIDNQIKQLKEMK